MPRTLIWLTILVFALFLVATEVLVRPWIGFKLPERKARLSGSGETERAKSDTAIPDLAGYLPLRQIALGDYTAVIYRLSRDQGAAPEGRLVVYNQKADLVFDLATREAASGPATQLFDFSKASLPARPIDALPGKASSYLYDLDGDGTPNLIVGNYSLETPLQSSGPGQDCCTQVSVLSLEGGNVRVLHRLTGLVRPMFSSLELKDLNDDGMVEIIDQHPFLSGCSPVAVILPIIYATSGASYRPALKDFSSRYEEDLRTHQQEWQQRDARTRHLLESLVLDYSALGDKNMAWKFYQENLSEIPEVPGLRAEVRALCDKKLQNWITHLAEDGTP